ncbi:MAG: carbamoyltransferase HypF [Rhodospirillales bacterium]|nr:carbamoyltransferase HypF [Rhodospirillales bacterium]
MVTDKYLGDLGPVEVVIPLPRPAPTVLALGAFLKNTVCLAEGDRALVSASVGNLESAEALRQFENTSAALLAMAGTAPGVVTHDLHPDFPSTHMAEATAAQLGIEALPVQHHHAHVAAVMAEHGLEDPVLGLALDGYGFGDGGEMWGGELLYVDGEGFRRVGHLAPLRQPGGDAAARQPWRMAAAALHALGRTDDIPKRFHAFAGAPVITQMLERGFNAPWTSSCGRLFDAACGLLGVMPVAALEGEAPMALEALVSDTAIDPHGWRLTDGVLDMTPLLARLIDREPADGANLFHGTLVAAMTDWVQWAATTWDVRWIVLCGGCFLNRVLKEGLTRALHDIGLLALSPRQLGPGDTAISLGQAWVAVMADNNGKSNKNEKKG